MSKLLVSDALWTLIAPLLPPEQPKPKGGRPRIPDRAALTGILFVFEERYPPGDATPGDGLRQWDDLLAAPARLAMCRRLETPPPGGVAAVARGGTDRLGAGVTRQCERAGSRGRSEWQGSDQPRQAGHQAAPRGRPYGPAAGGDDLGGQRA